MHRAVDPIIVRLRSETTVSCYLLLILWLIFLFIVKVLANFKKKTHHLIKYIYAFWGIFMDFLECGIKIKLFAVC